MTAEQVKIGRRFVPLNEFKVAVEEAGKLSDVLVNIGFNPAVATTKDAVKERIEELGLDTSHFKWNYTMSEAVRSGAKARTKQFKLSDSNRKYYEAFQEYIDPGSWGTYKATIGNYLQKLGTNDFATISKNNILKYTDGKVSAVNHLRSLMIFIVKNNVNNAVDKVSKDMLIWLIGKCKGK